MLKQLRSSSMTREVTSITMFGFSRGLDWGYGVRGYYRSIIYYMDLGLISGVDGKGHQSFCFIPVFCLQPMLRMKGSNKLAGLCLEGNDERRRRLR
jgi:hypothetical protein